MYIYALQFYKTVPSKTLRAWSSAGWICSLIAMLFLLLLLFFITFIRSIYNYMPEINHLSKDIHFCSYSVFTNFATCICVPMLNVYTLGLVITEVPLQCQYDWFFF